MGMMGFIGSGAEFIESDTLADVTGRGSTTTTGVTFNSGGTGANDFLFGRSSMTGDATGFGWDQGKISFFAGRDIDPSTDIGNGCFMFASGPGNKQSTGEGTFVAGLARTGATLTSSGKGSSTFGLVTTGSSMTSSDYGASCSGATYGPYCSINASGAGAFSHGFSYSGGMISSNGFGATAFGYANSSGGVYALGTNVFQFGQGYNNEADSLQVGTDLRLCSGGVPGNKKNGDFWLASGYVYIRSNGVDVKIT